MATQSPTPAHSDPGVPRTRTAWIWIASILFAIVLLLLLIFILQNGQRARISFFGAHANPPIGVALLLAAVFGILLVALPGTARILQLRLLARRRAAVPEPPAAPVAPEPPGPPVTPVAPVAPEPLIAPEPTVAPPSTVAPEPTVAPPSTVAPERRVRPEPTAEPVTPESPVRDEL